MFSEFWLALAFTGAGGKPLTQQRIAGGLKHIREAGPVLVGAVRGIDDVTVGRWDRAVLAAELPEPDFDAVDKLLVDEKHLGARARELTQVRFSGARSLSACRDRP